MSEVREFKYPIQVGGKGSKKYTTRVARFGDGYAQTAGEGINESRTTWNIARTTTLEGLTPIIDFFDSLSGYKSFIWRDPTGKLGLYRVEGLDISPHSRDVFTLTAQFVQSFSP